MKGYGITDKGNKRAENQDGFLFELFPETDSAIFVVCDGMGGAQAGGYASRIGLKTFFEYVLQYIQSGVCEKQTSEVLIEAACLANNVIFTKAMFDENAAGMGTTLVAALIHENDAVIANIGDSRAYLISGKRIRRITRDHSVVEDMVSSGKLTREQARVHPKKNLITRALGVDSEVECDIFTEKIETGDILLLCTDGLSNLFTDDELLKEINSVEAPEQITGRLLELSLEKGAPDNVTLTVFIK